MTHSNAAVNGKEDPKAGHYTRLFRKFIGLTLIGSLVPLLVVGWGINLHYTKFAKDRMIESFRSHVDYHRRLIELFLDQNRSKLQLIVNTHAKDHLSNMATLSHVFEMINRDHRAITDLGVIDAQGSHLTYIGPYDLLDKNYSQALWFEAVMEKGLYISDMFRGFRGVPHFVIAVTDESEGEKWILRATIDTEAFRSLVENVRIGQSGEVYLLNQQGVYQTSPRFHGRIMEKAAVPMGPTHEDTKVRIIHDDNRSADGKSSRQILAQARLNNPRWMLVVRQDYSEAFDAVNHANYATLIFLHIAAFSILLVSMLITKHMIKIIKERDRDTDLLNQQLLQTGKMASIGELSAGVAHEINNPLAIILTERQILLDISGNNPALDPEFKRSLEESLWQIDVQVNRCKRIIHNLLTFSRRTESMIETVDLNDFITEVVDLVEREAGVDGIRFKTTFEKDLPPILSDPSQLQQVFLNLAINAMSALQSKPYGSICLQTRMDNQNNGIEIKVSDTGSGIAPEHIDRIFDPFFTTKPVGKGTGLGLSICYSIMERLGGSITAKSEMGKGCAFTLFLPFDLPSSLRESIGKEG